MDEWISQLPPQSVWIGIGLLVALSCGALLAGRLRLGRLDILSLMAACIVGGGVGSRVTWVLLDPEVTWGLVSSNALSVLHPLRGGHSSFGAMLGGGLVLLLWWFLSHRGAFERASASKALGFGWLDAGLHTLDIVVVAGLSGLGFARLGCLANGCDFGSVTDAPWALRYSPGTEAFGHHLATRQIGWGADWSLAVHPYALYLAAGIFVIVGVAGVQIWSRGLRPGRVAGWSCLSYMLWRFCVEWTRDPVTVLDIWGAFNIHHFMAICAAIVFGVLLWLETRARSIDRHRAGGD